MTTQRLDEALELWRGPAYAEFAERGWAIAEATRLDELRAQALEYRADAGLRSGRSAEVVPDMAAHVLQHPLRERAWTLLAAAQYATGAQGTRLPPCVEAASPLRKSWAWSRVRHCAPSRPTFSPRLTIWFVCRRRGSPCSATR